MYPYIPNSHNEEKEMLQGMGLTSVDQLFEDIPQDVKLKRKLNLNPSMSELEVSKLMKDLSNKNFSNVDLTCFLGGGAYDDYIP